MSISEIAPNLTGCIIIAGKNTIYKCYVLVMAYETGKWYHCILTREMTSNFGSRSCIYGVARISTTFGVFYDHIIFNYTYIWPAVRKSASPLITSLYRDGKHMIYFMRRKSLIGGERNTILRLHARYASETLLVCMDWPVFSGLYSKCCGCPRRTCMFLHPLLRILTFPLSSHLH